MPVIGEVNGNPLQYSCLENPMDRGGWYRAEVQQAQLCPTSTKWECLPHCALVALAQPVQSLSQPPAHHYPTGGSL